MGQENEAAVLSLRERRPGHAVIHALLCQPGMLRPRGSAARLFGRSPLTEQGMSWYRGALGELAVGRMLSKLGTRWVIMHAVPVGLHGADIDHLIVGSAGVFTVNTKNHAGKRIWVMDRSFLVAGQRCHHIRNSEHEASRVAKTLGGALGRPVHVRSIVAVVDPAQLDIRQRPAGVEVLEARKLVRWLKKRKPVLTDEELAQIKQVIGVPATWRYQPDAQADLDRRQLFDDLQSEIRQAVRRRTLSASILTVLVVLAALVAVSQLT
jgi:hypothetical protein